MKECPHCHKDLPDDSTFCTYCGKPVEVSNMKNLEKTEEKISHEKEQKLNSSLKQNPHMNNWSKLGIILFLTALIGLDFITASIVSTFGINAKFVFILSSFVYICSIGCGIMSLVTDHLDKKKGYLPNGSVGFAMVSVAMSCYIALLNLTTVILK